MRYFNYYYSIDLVDDEYEVVGWKAPDVAAANSLCIGPSNSRFLYLGFKSQ